ncbi:MAG TPA: hypothetical protein VIK02_00060 [Candidatus Anoxymicrobiaceae bacterium]
MSQVCLPDDGIVRDIKDVKAVMYLHKLNSKCAECGEDHPVCLLYFDEKTEKTVNAKAVNRLRARNRNISIEGLVKLLDGFTILCQNCKRKRYPEPGPPWFPVHLQRELNRFKTKQGCIHCEERNSRCLDFHHRDSEEKLFTIGHGSVLDKEAIELEMQKCDVTCRNCHTKEHWFDEWFSPPAEETPRPSS